MIFPLDLFEIGLLLAIIALILIITSELILSPRQRKLNMLINKKKMRRAAILFSILFLAIVALRIVSAVFEAVVDFI